jgi:tetratricopeptide (TPR) repeat protein
MSGSSILDIARDAILRHDYVAAERLLLDGIKQTPSAELRRALAGVYRQTGRDGAAEGLLKNLLAIDPGDIATGFALATLYRDHGRLDAAGSTLRTALTNTPIDSGLAIEASRLFSECDCNQDALRVTEDALRLNPGEGRLHARAAMFCMQLGKFDEARQHYLQTLDDPVQACEWHVPAGLASAQHYVNADHPDFARFQDLLHKDGLSAKARASLNFAIGKAFDDIGDYDSASGFFRQANGLIHGLRQWNRKQWRRSVSGLMGTRSAPPAPSPRSRTTPVLLVGMPRSGSTLAAKLLSRFPDVCNRGELPWLGMLMQHPAMAGTPKPETLREAAAIYEAHLLRDDSDARWFIDKQPFNFRYIDRFLAMFPHARIIHCTRSPRDVALSLWTQSFSDEILGFSCDFADIAVVMQDCDRLMARWTAQYPASIRTLRYEALVADPDAAINQISEWLGLPAAEDAAPSSSADNISTASLWQARQPVHQRSVARWQHYLPYVPELERFGVD